MSWINSVDSFQLAPRGGVAGRPPVADIARMISIGVPAWTDPTCGAPTVTREAEMACPTFAADRLPSWYAIRTLRNHERVVADGASLASVESYLPLREERRQWKHRTRLLQVPLFTGYVFVRFQPQNRLPILRLHGVVEIVGTHEGPSPVPEEQIESVRMLVNSKLRYDPYPFLIEGASVRVKRGPLRGQTGVLVEKKGLHRFMICLPLLGQSVGVEIDAGDLEAA